MTIQEKDGAAVPPKRVNLDLQLVREMSLSDFASKHSFILFSRKELPDGFFAIDPEEWDGREDFSAAAVINDLKVVNDHAERGVALVQELNGLLTGDDEQFQFMLQVVQENRCLYPDLLKRTLMGQQ
jgi:hypothetical protein